MHTLGGGQPAGRPASAGEGSGQAEGKVMDSLLAAPVSRG